MRLKQTVENVYLRQDAVRLTRKHFWRLLGMMVLVFILSAAFEAVLTALGDAINHAEIQSVLDAVQTVITSDHIVATQPVEDALDALFSSPKYLLFNLVYILLTSLLSLGLKLGCHAQEIAAGRGGAPRVLGAFSRMRSCLKGLGLALLTGLKIGLWLLPGFVVVLIGAELEVYSQLGAFISLLGTGLLFGLSIPALFRYAMAPYILADDPTRGVRECITLSTGLMKYRKWQYFKLCVPMVLKMLGTFYLCAVLGTTLLTAAGLYAHPLGVLLLLLVIIVFCVYFTLQMNMACALFYLKRQSPPEGAKTSYWLRDHSTPEPAAASSAEPPEDTSPATQTTNEEKEIYHEEPDC